MSSTFSPAHSHGWESQGGYVFRRVLVLVDRVHRGRAKSPNVESLPVRGSPFRTNESFCTPFICDRR